MTTEPAAHGRNGSGLGGLADRVASVGGHLYLDSPPGQGPGWWRTFPVHDVGRSLLRVVIAEDAVLLREASAGRFPTPA